MTDVLSRLRETLLEGIKLSMQSSCARRSPAPGAIPYLESARRSLREFSEHDPNNVEALRLLSQAEECLLNYREAISCIERAMKLEGSKNKRDLKRPALLQEAAKEWWDLCLSPEDLRRLGEFLQASGADDPTRGRSLEFTKQWLRIAALPVDPTLEAFSRRGAFTDFQVLNNLVRG